MDRTLGIDLACDPNDFILDLGAEDIRKTLIYQNGYNIAKLQGNKYDGGGQNIVLGFQHVLIK